MRGTDGKTDMGRGHQDDRGAGLGRKSMDLLTMACAIGIARGEQPWEITPKKGLLYTIIIFSYLETWNTSLRFGLHAPLTLDNPVLADWKNYALMIFLYFVSGFSLPATLLRVEWWTTGGVGGVIFTLCWRLCAATGHGIGTASASAAIKDSSL